MIATEGTCRICGWTRPSLHGEDGCERCGGPNIISWFVDSALWNLATDNERHLMLCPQCFVKAWAERTGLGDQMVWELRLDLPQ